MNSPIGVIAKIRQSGRDDRTVVDGDLKISESRAGALTAARIVSSSRSNRDRLVEILGSHRSSERAAIVWADTPAADRGSRSRFGGEFAETVSPVSVSETSGTPRKSEVSDTSGDDWPEIDLADYRYLAEPATLAGAVCLVRWTGSPLGESCDELRRSWTPEMPFGKHKGKRLYDVPRRYLRWLLREADLQSDLRRAIEEAAA